MSVYVGYVCEYGGGVLNSACPSRNTGSTFRGYTRIQYVLYSVHILYCFQGENYQLTNSCRRATLYVSHVLWEALTFKFIKKRFKFTLQRKNTFFLITKRSQRLHLHKEKNSCYFTYVHLHNYKHSIQTKVHFHSTRKSTKFHLKIR